MDALLTAVRRVEVMPGVSLNAFDHGIEGPPLVLLHGLGATWTSWVFAVPMLTPPRRVIAFDLPGHGASDTLPGAPTIPGVARLLLGWLEREGLAKVEVAGASLGGLIAVEMAALDPVRVGRLALLAPPTPEVRERTGRVLSSWVRADGRPRFETVDDLLWVTPQASQQLLPLANLGLSACRSFQPCLAAIASYDTAARLPLVSCPVDLIWGEADRLVPLGEAAWWQARLTRARLHAFPGVGHNPAFDAPEGTAEALLGLGPSAR